MFPYFTKYIPKRTFLFLLFIVISVTCISQNKETKAATDTTTILKKKNTNRYDSATLAHSPKKAAIRSAIFPGLGQIYNKKYWKLPIVYGVMGTCTGIFIYNLNSYRDTRFAYRVKYNMRVSHTDSALYADIKKDLQPLTEESLRFYRNEYRRDIDYSALIFLLMWGLNVIDAAVDAHLQSFDVGPDLSLRFKAGYSELAKTNGISLVLTIGK